MRGIVTGAMLMGLQDMGMLNVFDAVYGEATQQQGTPHSTDRLSLIWASVVQPAAAVAVVECSSWHCAPHFCIGRGVLLMPVARIHCKQVAGVVDSKLCLVLYSVTDIDGQQLQLGCHLSRLTIYLIDKVCACCCLQVLQQVPSTPPTSSQVGECNNTLPRHTVTPPQPLHHRHSTALGM
jgi:hypothetical protein